MIIMITQLLFQRRRISKTLLRIVIAGSLCVGLLQAAVAEPGARRTSEQEYMISSDDILEISVYGEPDLSVTVRVSPDGSIIYPLLGNVRASGLSVRELEANISDLLAEDYLVNPQVSILIKEYSKISILGAVRSPGSYQIKGVNTLTQAIALAGGFTDAADTSRVKIVRSVGQRKETVETDIDAILEKSALDPEVRSNDTIIVDEYGRFSIMGQVMKPGVYTLRKGLTVVEAIGLAGGFSSTASQNGTRVVRIEDGKKRIISVPVADITRGGDSSRDVLLQPQDTVVVPESFF